MLAAYPEAFLGIGDALPLGLFIAQEEVFKLVHPRVGEQQGGVVFHYDRSGRDDVVPLRDEKSGNCCLIWAAVIKY